MKENALMFTEILASFSADGLKNIIFQSEWKQCAYFKTFVFMFTPSYILYTANV